MSYDIELIDPVTKQTAKVDKHQMRGGTYCLGGTDEACLNITYNYGKFYYNVIDQKEGIRFIYGKTGAESISILKDAINKLGDDVVENYWTPTEGNAKQALYQLLALAQLRPDCIWRGD